MKQGWRFVRLGDVLNRNNTTTILDPASTYREVTVRLWGRGVVLRREVFGAEIAAERRFVVTAGQFIVSRIDARHGAFGVVPAVLDGAVVTNDFPSYNVNADVLNPRFLEWLTRTSAFVEACKAASEGTTNRVRLSEQKFLDTTISLPPPDEQARIVRRIDDTWEKLAEVTEVRAEIASERDALKRATSNVAFARERQPRVQLEEVCAAIIDNLHSNPVYEEGGPVACVRSPDVGWGRLNLASALRTSEAEFLRRTVRGEPRPGDLVFVREGGGTGKCALVQPGDRFSLGQRVMMLRPDESRVRPRFLLQQLLSPAVQGEQIAPLITGSAAPHLNIGDLRKFDVYVPELEEQVRIEERLAQLDQAMEQATTTWAEAGNELESVMPAVLARAFSRAL